MYLPNVCIILELINSNIAQWKLSENFWALYLFLQACSSVIHNIASTIVCHLQLFAESLGSSHNEKEKLKEKKR